MEDNHRWKTTFDGRQPSMEDDLRWKTPLMEDDLQWKTTFDGRRPSMEDNLRWKTTFDGRRPWMENDLGSKTTLDGRRPWMEDARWFLGDALCVTHSNSRMMQGFTLDYMISNPKQIEILNIYLTMSGCI